MVFFHLPMVYQFFDFIVPANVQELLLAATYFQVEDLQSVCIGYLKDKTDKR